ncbi:conserved hypothetical protein, partial [delta proteobacterium NaphS2]
MDDQGSTPPSSGDKVPSRWSGVGPRCRFCGSWGVIVKD